LVVSGFFIISRSDLLSEKGKFVFAGLPFCDLEFGCNTSGLLIELSFLSSKSISFTL
jgi:hypothetical protein